MSQSWIDVLADGDLPTDDVIGIEAAGRQVAIYAVNGEVFASDNICTHGHARLCDGFLEGYEIECPLHQGRFDIRSGKAMCEPLTEDVKTYPVKIENGRVFVDMG
jgi:naphthalene 1,2-dioxygenase system ferredoxin subunit